MQLSHDVGITYSAHLTPAVIHATVEIDNAANSKLFDSYGAQRPGRAYYFNLATEI